MTRRAHPVLPPLTLALCTLLAGSACYSTHGHARPESPLPVRQVAPAAGAVTFEQVTFDFDAGRLEDSDWGQVRAWPDELRWATGMSEGYLNVLLQRPGADGSGGVEWVVRNVFVPKPPCDRPAADPTPPLATYIDLRPGVDGSGGMDRILATVLHSRQALPETTGILDLLDDFEPTWFQVERAVHNNEETSVRARSRCRC